MYLKTRLILVVVCLATAAAGFGQNVNHSIEDPVRKQTVLVDNINREGLQIGEFATFYKEEYDAYNPDKEVLDQLAGLIQNFDVHIILATWCTDSKREVPRFIKLLDAVNYPEEKITMIGVDSYKKAYELDIDSLDINFVPTFIILRNDIEIGRIIERPVVSLESDLLELLTR